MRSNRADLPAFMRRFERMCSDACGRGWHEANGGNLSYRLTDDDVAEARSSFVQGQEWHKLELPFADLAGNLILMTASGAYLQNVARDALSTTGVIEISEDGAAWRTMWGFEDAAPSSELMTHLAAYAEGIKSGDGADRVVYHAHPAQVIALSATIPADSRRWTRALWQCMTESIIMFPQGVASIEWMIPGSEELAKRTCEYMRDHHVCVWAHHGIMVRAADFDGAFGMVDTIQKAAKAYLSARSANGGSEPAHLVSDEQLRAVCARYGIHANEAFLD